MSGLYDRRFGAPVLAESAILMPYAWFDYENGSSALLEYAYMLVINDTTRFYVGTLFLELSNRTEPLKIAYNNSQYVAAVGSHAYRNSFKSFLSQYSRENDYSQPLLRLYYEEPIFEQTIAYGRNEFVVDRAFADISITFKVHEFERVWLAKESPTHVSAHQSYPVLECRVSSKKGALTGKTIMYAADPQVPYFHHQAGRYALILDSEIDQEDITGINSGEKYLSQCDLWVCDKESSVADFRKCQYATPVLGIPVEYQLPNESVSIVLIIGYSFLCVAIVVECFMLAFFAVQAQRAKARRVSSSGKNGIRNLSGARGRAKFQ